MAVLPKVVVTLPIPDAVKQRLASYCVLQCWDEPDPIPCGLLQEWLKDSVGILCSLGTRISADMLADAKQLRVISTVSVGVDHIDVAAASRAGIAVGHTPGVLTDSTADLALALMLALSRRVVEGHRYVASGEWTDGWSPNLLLGSDLSRARVGLVGLGPIGQAVAKRLRAFGSEVIAWNRTPRHIEGVSMVDLDTLFTKADFVSLHVASTADTYHLVSRDRLAQMKLGATLINTARGALVDEQALAEALASGRLSAGLDVYQTEPLPQDSRLLGLDNVVLLPHVGSATATTRHAMMALAIDNLVAGLHRQPLPAHCNPAQ